MACKEIEKISGYMDHELDEEQSQAVEAHIASCRDCKSVLSAMRVEKRLVNESFLSLKASGNLKKRIISVLNEQAEKGAAYYREPSIIRRLLAPNPAWALVSMIFLLLAGMILLKTEGIIFPAGEKPTTMGLYLKDITHDSYLTYNLPKRPLDVRAQDAATVEEFLSGYVGFDVHVPDMQQEGYKLRGGRLWHTVSRISALAFYEDASGNVLSLFEIKKGRIGKRGARTFVADGRTFYFGEGFGYNGVVWVQDDVALGIVGDVSFDVILNAARSAAKSLAR